MSKTIYATFASESDAERAAGALRDHGVAAQDVSFLLPVDEQITEMTPSEFSDTTTQTIRYADAPAPDVTLPSPPPMPTLPRQQSGGLPEDVMGVPSYRYDALGAVIPDKSHPSPTMTALAADTPRDVREHEPRHILDMEREQPKANTGITTTTAGDAAKGALEGTGIGLGLGLALGLATIFLPGFGFVAGTGALVAGLTAATGAAGGIAGGVFGYLVDLGVPHEAAQHISDHLEAGCPILSVTVGPETREGEVTALLRKYNATFVEAY
jgi:hypothetical protein